MSLAPPPPVDPRTHDDFVLQAEALLERYAGFTPRPGDPAAALVRVFARMAGRVAERLNRMPERAFLAFLDLLGVEPLPPQPARALLAFSLAAGARADAVVPARTAVAGTPLEGEAAAPEFETERELVVTRTTLDAVLAYEPARDRWADRTAQAAAGAPFAAFAGEAPVMHRLHLSHRAAFGATGGTRRVWVRFTHAPGPAVRWPELAEWSWRDAEGEHPLVTTGTAYGTTWEVAFAAFPSVPITTVDDVAGAWLSARLPVPLRQRGVSPDAVWAGDGWAAEGETLFPFGRTSPGGFLALSAPDVFGVPGVPATLEVRLDDTRPPPVPAGLRLRWEYRTAAGWSLLAMSSPATEVVGPANPFAFADGTRAFTRDGTVSFQTPPGWAAGAMNGRDGLWLRVTPDAGGWGPGGDFHPPALRPPLLGYDLPVPPLTAVQALVERTQHFGPLTARGLGRNNSKIGGFYLALPQLRGKAGVAVTLRFAVNPLQPGAGAATTQPSLRWEHWNGTAWQPFGDCGPGVQADYGFGFVDGSRSLTLAASAVTFRAPTLGRTTVYGILDAWIRVTITAGDYGQQDYRPVDASTALQEIPLDKADPPWFDTVEMDYAEISGVTPADAVVAENGWSFEARAPAGAVLAPISPFTLLPDPRPSLYLGFGRPDEAVGFANRATALYLGVGEAFGEPDEPADAPPLVGWWYWDGRGWARLAVEDETGGLARRGVVSFVGPPDFRASAQLGRQAFWLRLTVEQGEWPRPPRLERVLLNAVWAEQAAALGPEVLGSGTGRPAQAFRTLRAPVLPGERIDVREPAPPPAAEPGAPEREAGLAARSVGGDAAGGAEAAGEAWVRWTAVPDFRLSGPESRHYVVDRATGEVRFGDGVHGRVPPPGRANVRAAAYRSGGGPAGNRPAGNLTRLKTPLAYVDRVTNPDPAGGGAAGETLDAVRARGPRTLRHGGRAVALADLEDLAMEASPQVAEAHAVPAAEGTEGRVAVIVVPRGAEAWPAPSLELLERVRAYLADRLPATVELAVMGPEWVAVSVAVEVVPVSVEAAGQVLALLPERLASYLHPLTGGPDGTGWTFGRRPWRSDLFAVAEATPGVDHVRLLEVAEDPAPATAWFRVTSGTHAVRVAGPALEP